MTELEHSLAELVRQAPAIDRATAEAAAAAALAIAAAATGDRARLALVVERVIDDLAGGEIDLAVGLPATAMAATTLATTADALALTGAIYELETLLPIPGRGDRRIDVPLAALTSRETAPVDRAAPARAARLAATTAPPDVLAARRRYDR
jgi:hypothetical protein